MNADQAYGIIFSNLSTIVGCMVKVEKGTKVDAYCDSTGRILSFSRPSGDANIKLCSIKAPDLEGSYGLYRRGDSYATDEGEAVAIDQLATYVTGYIQQMQSEGNEWGWEFEVGGP